MKNFNLRATFKGSLICTLISLFSMLNLSGQDTLHLYYHHTQIKPHDTTIAKLSAWAKKLNGQHVDINVVAYFHKPEFKKFSQQRCDELFLELNRKARSLITIKSMGPKKGEAYQRTTVDIIYTPTIDEAAAKAQAEAAKKEKAEKKKTDDANKDVAKSKEPADGKSKDKKSEGGEEKVAKGKDKKGGKGKEETSGEPSNVEAEKEAEREKKGKRGDSHDEGFYGQSTQVTFNDGYKLTLEEVNFIRRGKVIVGESGISNVDNDLYTAVQKSWDFNTNISRMPYQEALKMGKANKKDTIVIISFMRVKTWFEQRYGPVKVRIAFVGFAVGIENNKGKTLVKQFVTKAREQQPTIENLTFGVSVLNDLCHTMFDNKLPKSSKADPFYDLRTPELKNKTLLIPEFMLHPKLPRQDIPLYYSSKFKIVPDDEWKDAILQKKDVAYVMIVMLPRPPMDNSTGKDYFKYAVDAKTGKLLFVDYGSGGFITGGVRTDQTQSGYFDKANFERFEKGIHKAEVDNANRAEKKAGNEEKDKAKAAKKEKDLEAKKS